MVIMVITATMGTMETMEITTIMVIILTSMLHQKPQSLVEMVMDPMEMAMDLMEMDPMEMVTDLMEMDLMETDPMEMDPMEMEMDLTITEMGTDPMDCAARSHVKSANQSGSQSVRIIPLPAAKKSQRKSPPQSQLKSASRS